MTDPKGKATAEQLPVKPKPEGDDYGRSAAAEQIAEAQADMAAGLQAQHDAKIAALEAKIAEMNAK